MELKKYKLGEILELQRGYDLPSSKMENGSVPVAGSNGIIGYHNVAKIQPPCLTIGRSGSVGKVHFYEEPIWPHNTSLYVKDFKGNDERYVYYLLKNIDLSKLCDSSVVPSLNRNYVYPLEVFFYCDKINQRRIASVLSSLDSKIALNRRINTKLETIAKRLYDYWFVQFDFPDANGNPYKSSGGKMVWNDALKREIPEGWEVKSVKEIASFTKETIRPSDNPNLQYKHFSIPSFDDCGSYILEYGNNILSDKFKVTNTDILVSKLNPWTSRVVWGENNDNQICSTEYVVLKLNVLYEKGFLYYLVKHPSFIDYCTQGASGTSHSHRRVNPDYMMRYGFAYNQNIIKHYSDIVSRYVSIMLNNLNQIRVLTALRDKLLPLLMNGQVEVA